VRHLRRWEAPCYERRGEGPTIMREYHLAVLPRVPRGPIVLAAGLGALLACATAASDATAATRAGGLLGAPRRMVVTPRQDAKLFHPDVHVALRVPPGTTRMIVRVGDRDVTSRFRARGGRRVATLTRGNGLRYGRNRLFVTAERGAQRPLVQARSFFLARRVNSLARLRVRPGAVTSARLRLVGPARRVRSVRFRLNGRLVTRAAKRPSPNVWTESLSAAHHLRYGVNRLRVLVVEPGSGRYALFRRRFRIRRARPLAAAGWDKPVSVGARVRLNGGRSRAGGRGRVRYRWAVVGKPRGTRVALRRAGRKRAAFVPRRPGHYVVRLRVRRRGRVGTDRVGITVIPKQLLQPFAGITHQDGKAGIEVGGTFYPNPSPNGAALQWLTLDRATLTPAKNGNSWLDGSGSGDHGINQLTSALASEGLDQIVILASPYGAPAPPVQADQNDAFNADLKQLGVKAIPADILQDRNKLGIVGVPFGGAGSGWYTHGGSNVDGLTGYLMPDATDEPGSGAARFRFQPQRLHFDTSAASSQTTNTMDLDGRSLASALPGGATGGFQVVRLNPIDFTPADPPQVFATNGVSDPVGPLQAMAKYLNDNANPNNDMAVQSIGQVSIPPPPSDPYAPDTGGTAWRAVAHALSAYGANPDTFNRVNGSYAFLGGPNIDRSEVAESSSQIVTDPTTTPPKHEAGTVEGMGRMASDGYFVPTLADPSDAFQATLYNIVTRPPIPWPHTKASGDPDYAQYDKALAYITSKLSDVKGYYPDLRQAYVGNDNLTWGDSKTDLAILKYPGDKSTCAGQPAKRIMDPGYTRNQFCTLSRELQHEFDWLDATKTLFDSYEKALSRSGGQEQVDLHTIGENIRKDVEPPDDASIFASAVKLLETALALAGPEAAEAGHVIAFLSSAYEFGSTLASNAAGQPVGDRVNTKVGDLSQALADNLSGTANALDRMRDVVISDYGRLWSLGQVADTPDWTVDVPAMTSNLTTAANGYFTSQLLPVAYDAWYLSTTPFNNNPTPDNCFIIGYGHSFEQQPADQYLTFRDKFDGAQGVENLLSIGKHTWTASDYAYPRQDAAADLVDTAFSPVAQNGYGLRLSDFFWQSYKAPYRTVNCH
jgi:hypothetical protein